MAKRAYNIPNMLTYGRIIAVPLIVLCFFVEGTLQSTDFARWTALGLFTLASITDFLDGYLARIWKQTSNIGKMLDPIADKLLVSSVLLLVAADGTIAGWSLWAAIIILCREILVSGLREYLAALKVSVPVTRIAKWKTTAQMVAIGFLLAGPAGDKALDLQLHGGHASSEIVPYATLIGILLLWVAAILTIYTGYDYFRAGLKHVVEEDE
jgi:cardiolipin synthase